MSVTVPELRTRKPTGAVPWPLILVEGEEKAGKTVAAVILSASEKVGQTYWIDLGEGSADEYGAWPGARHEVLIHDGTYASILGQIRAVKAEAERAAAAGEPPTVLVIDTITDLWDGLKEWANGRARDRARGKGKKVDDDDEIDVSMDLWNDAGERHKTIMTLLQRFAGIAVVIARGGEVAAVENGKPVNNKRVYRVEGHRSLASKVTVWLRMERGSRPVIVGARSVYAGVRPDEDKPKPVPAKAADGNLLEWLIFDSLRCDPTAAHVRDIQHTTGGELLPEERTGAPVAQADPPDAGLVRQFASAIAKADTWERLRTALAAIAAREKAGELTGAGAAHLTGLVAARRAAIGIADDEELVRLGLLLGERGVGGDDERLLVAVRITGRHDLESTSALTGAEVEAVIRAVENADPSIDLVTGERIPDGAGVDPAQYEQQDANGQAA